MDLEDGRIGPRRPHLQIPGGHADQRHEEGGGQGRGQAKPPGGPPSRAGGDLADVRARRIELRPQQAPERGRLHLLARARLFAGLSERRRGR